jgi:hypothetical protein
MIIVDAYSALVTVGAICELGGSVPGLPYGF